MTGFDCANARWRLVIVGAFSLCTAFSESLWTLGAALAMAAGTMVAARLPMRTWIIRLISINLVLATMWVLVPLRFSAGEGWGWTVTWSREAAIVPLLATLRANAIILFATALLTQLGIAGISRGLASLPLPSTFARLIAMSARYLSVLRNEFARMRTAIVARGFQMAANRRSYHVLANATGMLLLRSLDRAERVRRAMEARTFDQPVRWTRLSRPAPSRPPFALLACPLTLVVLETTARWIARS